MASVWFRLILACDGSSPTLVLSGPAEVHIHHTGPVDAPKVMLEDGSAPVGVIWSLSREGVARIEGDRVVAEGPGEVDVVAEWEGMQVRWKLVVELATSVSFVSPPSTIRVGQSRSVAIKATAGERVIEPGPIEWTASDPSIFRVDGQGTLTALSPGVGYLTARAAGAFAMVQIEVTP